MKDVKSLLARLASDPPDLNAIVDLLKIVSNSSKPTLAFDVLQNAFISLIQKGQLIHNAASLHTLDPASKEVYDWLSKKYAEYQQVLFRSLAGENVLPATQALTALMNLLKAESERLTALAPNRVYRFASPLWSSIVTNLLSGPLPADLQYAFVASYLNYYDDIRYYFLKEAASQSADNTDMQVAEKLLELLEQIDSMPREPSHLNRFLTTNAEKLQKRSIQKSKKRKRKIMEQGDGDEATGIFDSSSDEQEGDEVRKEAKVKGHKLPELLSIRSHRKVFQQCWMALFPQLRKADQVKRVLVIMQKMIIPHMQNAANIMDFLSDCCRHGGTIALLALNGLYTLMIQYNLDYPSFYVQLYGMLDSQLLHVKYRPRFFRMLELFLSSSRLPVIMIASFLKRLSRLTLFAPPSAIVSVIPFTYNMFKKHSQLVQMIHAPLSDIADETTLHAEDPFIADEADPMKTFALDSSLWELTSLSDHYLSSVSTLAKVFQQPMNKPSYDAEDFLDHTYTSLFDTETSRKLMNAPALDLPPIAAKKVALFPTSFSPGEQDWTDEIIDLFEF